MGRKIKPKYKKDDLITMIVDKVTSGIPQAQIVADIKSLGYSTTYFYELFREAKPIFQAALAGIAENRLEATIAEMEEQYKLALDAGDRRLANDIRKEINKISGLHQQKLDVTTNGDSINNISIIKIIEIQKEDDDTKA
jgi:hypothetical protein